MAQRRPLVIVTGAQQELPVGDTLAGIGAVGKTTVDFGAIPGTTRAKVDVTGQADIAAGSVVHAWIQADATADHSADEHRLEPLRVSAGEVAAGVGFAIWVEADWPTYGLWTVGWRRD
jgi:hypothetical protein